jgi:hypothetical protein
VVSELGDPGRPPIEVLANRSSARPGDYITLDDLRDCLRAAPGEELREQSAAAGSGQVRDPGEGEASE